MVTSHSQTLNGLTANTTYHYRVNSKDAAGNPATSTDQTFTTPTAGGTTTTYISDMTPTGTPTNGWGPIEKDKTNGENGANDGGPIVIGGQTFTKGLGTHANSDVTYTLPANCTAFTAQVGIDDDVATYLGSALFQVLNGTTKIYDSGLKTGNDPATAVNVNITGLTTLRLVTNDSNGNNNYDHTDWGDARITCSGSGGNTPPVPTITSPTLTQKFKVGDVIQLSGSATDAQDVTIPSSGLQWQINLHHCPGGVCHLHFFQTLTGATASFTAPDHGDDSYLEIILTATDSQGLTASVSQNLNPQTVKLTLASSPSGLQLVYGSDTVTTPFQATTIVGSTHTVSAPTPQGANTFSSWSDAGANQHNITVGTTDSTLTATFTGGGGGTTTTYISDMTPTGTPTNGWGPIEKDKTNGENGANDGGPIVIGGQTFTKGLGTHANSDVTYTLPANCTAFTAQVGIDDDVATYLGSALFQVFNGTTKIYDSGLKTGNDPATAVNVNITGLTTLRLVTNDSNGNNNYDHTDWGDAKITCSGSGGGDTTPPVISAIGAAPSATSATITWTTNEAATAKSTTAPPPATAPTPPWTPPWSPATAKPSPDSPPTPPTTTGSLRRRRREPRHQHRPNLHHPRLRRRHHRTADQRRSNVTPSQTGATVTWTTNEAATGQRRLRHHHQLRRHAHQHHPVHQPHPNHHRPHLQHHLPLQDHHHRRLHNTATTNDATFTTTAGGTTTTYISDMTPTGTPTNGWGPIEKDKTNGENGANDGGPIVIGGQTFTKGLGTHANSDVAYTLAATAPPSPPRSASTTT